MTISTITLTVILTISLLLADKVSSFTPSHIFIPKRVANKIATPLRVISSVQIKNSGSDLGMLDGRKVERATLHNPFASSSVDFIYSHDDEHFFDSIHAEDFESGTNYEYMPRTLLPDKDTILASSTNRLSRIELQKAISDVKRFVVSGTTKKGLTSEQCLHFVKSTLMLLCPRKCA